MPGCFFNCYKVVAVSKKSEKKKGNNKKRKGCKGNEEEGKKSASYVIYADAGMMIRSVHLGRKCD